MTPRLRRIWKRIRPVHVGLILVALLVVGLGVFCGVSFSNSITPAGIVIHHSAIPPQPDGKPIDANLMDYVHRMRGYRAFYWGRLYHLGFHYVIRPDGTIENVRPELCRGAHTVGYNSYLGICVVGNFSSSANPQGENGLAQPTEAQLVALARLSRELGERYGFSADKIVRHNQVTSKTECPGDRFPFEQLIKQLK